MQEYKVTVDTTGTIRFYKPGTYELHRLDGPAVEYANGTKRWYQHNQLHRIDGPALEYPSGSKQWCQNDQLHRIDGPAIEWNNGGKSWYQHGKRHRIDGPAVESSSGTIEYWIDGKQLPEEQFKKKTASVKEMTIAEIEARLGHKIKIV